MPSFYTFKKLGIIYFEYKKITETHEALIYSIGL